MKWIKVFEEFNDDINVLIEVLKKFNVPVELWGTGKSKTINHLLDEINNSECSLREENGVLTRFIEFVGIKIYYQNEEGEKFFLREERQEFRDGRVRRRSIPNSVSEKMRSGEDETISAVRGIEEELGVKISKDQLTKHKLIDYNGGSLSYPGLTTKYKGHQFLCNFNKSQFEPRGYIEIQKDKKTFFVWEKVN